MTPPRTVLHLVNRLDAGGVLRHVRDLADGLRDRGFESLIAAWTPPDSPLHDDNRFVHMPLFGKNGERKSLPGAVTAIRRLRRLCAGERVDILHMHSRYALLLGRAAGPASHRVYTAHNLFPDTGGRWLYPHAVIAPSLAVARTLSAQLDRTDANGMHVIPHGVRLPDQVDMLESGREPTFAWIGRLEEQKGLAHVLEAFALLARSGETPPRLEVIGEGTQRAALQRYCADHGIETRVRFHDWCADPFSILPAVRALLFSSLRLDAMPYTNLEAMARGIPVIATDLSVLDELVLHGKTGMRYPAGDAQALSAMLRESAGTPERMRALGEAAREHVAKCFTLDRMLRETAAVYRQLLMD
jgi:glycosyltransferase involved in cell wall biosynthesis